jgi:hypothetical protein
VPQYFSFLSDSFFFNRVYKHIYPSCCKSKHNKAFDAWEWTANIGAPAALVAGAVLVTLGETRETTGPKRTDPQGIRFLKRTMRFLLLSSFAMEVLSIFVSTMTGSVLLGHGAQTVSRKAIGYASPLQLLYYHHE